MRQLPCGICWFALFLLAAFSLGVGANVMLQFDGGVKRRHAWDIEYVTNELLIPINAFNDGTLYCVCKACFDDDLTYMVKSTQAATLKPQLIISDNLDFQVRYTNNKSKLMTAVIVGVKMGNDTVFKIQNYILKGRHFYINLIILQQPLNSMRLLEKILRKLHHVYFVNSDIYYWNDTSARNEVFGFSSYPDFAMRNKTALVGNWSLFYATMWEHKVNLLGHEMSTPVMQDAPDVIKYKDRDGITKITGVHYNILRVFFDYLNGSLAELEHAEAFRQVSMRILLELVTSSYVKITPHAYALYSSNNFVDKSYPTQVVNWCLMVPASNSISTLYYPFIPFEVKVWLCLALSWVALCCCEWFWLRARSQPRRHLLLANLCQLINLPQPYARAALTCTNFVYQSCIYAGGLLVAGYYTSMLGSILTVQLYHAQFNTMDDLIKVKLPVMIINYEYKFLLELFPTLRKDFIAILEQVNETKFYEHVYDFDARFAYFITEDKWRFLNLQQKYLKYPIFEYSPICFGTFHKAMPMVLDFPLWRNFEYFIYRIHSSGLYFHYETQAHAYALQAGIIHMLKDEYSHTIVGMQHLLIVFIIWAAAMLVACCVFAYEMRATTTKILRKLCMPLTVIITKLTKSEMKIN